MDQNLHPAGANAGTATANAPEVKPAPAARLPYVKPQVASDQAPLLALLSSQCDGVDTSNAG